MDENKSSKKPEPYTLVKPTDQKKFWGRVNDWFINLFKGWWYGMTDLFLASWTNVVLLVLLLLIPLVYGIVCALGYWNPTDNLGKVELPIFDADRTFLKVQDKTQDKEGNYYYKIGALESFTKADGTKVQLINSDNTINGSESADQLNDLVKKIPNDTTLNLNNGLTVKYNPSNVQITPMNSWEAIKNNMLVKKDSSKADQDTKFSTGVFPKKELHFQNIRYINDQDKINKYWKTQNYQAQIKINNGYGAALLGLEGIAYDSNPADLQSDAVQNYVSSKNQAELPIMDTYQTFQKNFISAYILGEMSQFSSVIMDQMSPFSNAFADNINADQVFGTNGQIIINFLKQLDKKKANLSSPIISKLGIKANDYYLVLSPDEFKDSLSKILSTDEKTKLLGQMIENLQPTEEFTKSTLFGNDFISGAFGQWLDNVNILAVNDGYAAVKADKSSTLRLVKNVEDMYGKLGKNPDDAATELTYLKGPDAKKQTDREQEKTFASAVHEILTKTAATDKNVQNLIGTILGTFAPIYGKAYSQILQAESANMFKTTPAFAQKGTNVLLPLIPSDEKAPINMFTLFTKMLNDNESTFFKEFFAPVRAKMASQGQEIGMMPVNLLGSVYGAMTTSLVTNGANPSGLVHMNESQGMDIAIYGIGLGQMFIFVGMYIGFTMIRSALKRNKQYAKLTSFNWYISKILQYMTIGIVQITLITWVMYGAGWHEYISASAMGYEYLWYLMSTMVIMSIIVGLQYAMNPMIGAVLGVLFLGVNITCSGASYPGWMESGFYRGITWIMPFKYLFEGSDQIIYGVNEINRHWGSLGGDASHMLHMTNERILQLWGYATCFFVFFIGIGFLGCSKSFKVACYGSARGKVVADTFKVLGWNEVLDIFVIHTTDKHGNPKTKYDWNAINGSFDSRIFQTTRHLMFERGHFKWYKEQRKKRRIEEIGSYDR